MSSPPNRRVLVVDDCESIHRDFAQLLIGSSVAPELAELETLLFSESQRSPDAQPSTFEMDCALQGEHAFELVRKAVSKGWPYAVAFIDMLMPPGWDGLTTIRHLWSVDPQLEIVICTAYSGQDWGAIMETVGESDQLLFLTKPFNGREVIQLAQTLSRKWTLRRDAERNTSTLERLVAERTSALQQATDQLSRTLLERQELARSIQETLNPPPDPVEVGSLVVAGYCQTCDDCGGDWWSYHPLSDGRLLVVLGDVTGHGIPATMLAAAARGAMGSMVEHCAQITPLEVLSSLDRMVRDVGRDKLWMTCLVALFDPAAGLVYFANAGHVLPLVLQQDGTLQSLIGQGTPLGSPSPYFPERQHPLQRGDRVVLYSDGLPERVDAQGKPFGERRLRSLLRCYRPAEQGGEDQQPAAECAQKSIASLRDTILQAVRYHGGRAALSDDLTLVVCHYR